MKNKKIDINHIAKLANLPLTAEEKKLYETQLSEILDYVVQVENADTKDVESTFNVVSEKNVTRADEIKESLTQDEALQNAVNKKDGFIVSRGVFEEE